MPEATHQPDHFDYVRTVNLHLRMAIDQVADGVAILEAEPLTLPGPRLVYVNRGLCKLVGIRAEDLLGQPLATIFDEERLGDFLATLPRVAEEMGKAFQTRCFLQLRNGSRKFCRWTVSSVSEQGGRALNFIITVSEGADAAASTPQPPTEPLRVDPEVSNETLLRIARLESLEKIAQGIGHNFRNELTGVILNIDNSLKTSPGSDKQLECLHNARLCAENAKDLSVRLMNYARSAAPQPKLEDLGAMVADSVRLVLSGSRCQGHYQRPENLWPARVDGTQIKQVINNLLHNSIEAMPGGGTIHIRVENVELQEPSGVADVAPGHYVVVIVHDRGCGIPPDKLEQLFKKDFTTKATGTGLGLISSYHVIRAHDGDMTVSSRVNVGTEFRVFLPASPGEARVSAPTAPDQIIVRHQGGSVLIVDDEYMIRFAVREGLPHIGYESEEAGTGEAAVELYRQRLNEGRPFRIVLMDRTLPGVLSGDDAMREIRRLDPTALVIAASGDVETDGEDYFRQLGYVGVLPKPFDFRQLYAALELAQRTSVVV